MQALTCSEYALSKSIEDNKALATTGDALLSFLFLDYLRENRVASTMEELSNWKEIIQNNEVLNVIGQCIFFNHDVRAINNDLKGNKSYATILEAYIYAIYLEDGFDYSVKYIVETIIPLLRNENVERSIFSVFNDKPTEHTTGKNWKKLIEDYTNFISK